MTKEVVETKEELTEEQKEEYAAASWAMLRVKNKDKRDAAKFFEADFGDLDSMDLQVLAVYAIDKSRSLEEWDDSPMVDLQKALVDAHKAHLRASHDVAGSA